MRSELQHNRETGIALYVAVAAVFVCLILLLVALNVQAEHGVSQSVNTSYLVSDAYQNNSSSSRTSATVTNTLWSSKDENLVLISEADIPSFQQISAYLPLQEELYSAWYQKETHGSSWGFIGAVPAKSFAQEVLLLHQERNSKLVYSDYLDLFGYAWGAVLEADEGMLIYTALPADCTNEAGANNALRICVERIPYESE